MSETKRSRWRISCDVRIVRTVTVVVLVLFGVSANALSQSLNCGSTSRMPAWTGSSPPWRKAFASPMPRWRKAFASPMPRWQSAFACRMAVSTDLKRRLTRSGRKGASPLQRPLRSPEDSARPQLGLWDETASSTEPPEHSRNFTVHVGWSGTSLGSLSSN